MPAHQVSICCLETRALLLWPCPWGLPFSLSLHPSRISQQYRVLLQKTSLSFCCPGASGASTPSKHSYGPPLCTLNRPHSWSRR